MAPTAHTVPVRTLHLRRIGRVAAVPAPILRGPGLYPPAPSTRGARRLKHRAPVVLRDQRKVARIYVLIYLFYAYN